MGSVTPPQETRPRYFNYPDPVKGPDVPYTRETKSSPVIRGVFLVGAAFLMEWVSILRQFIWHNAGFGSLRKIAKLIENFEPWFMPEVVPMSVITRDEAEEEDVDDDAGGDASSAATDAAITAAATPGTVGNGGVQYPAARYYSAADYRELYLSGKLTPTDVAKTLLPLIRRDTTPPGPHALAFFETREALVLEAAEASTRRYKERRSLGALDGVPAAVKDEYDMVGYGTCLGSTQDYRSPMTDATDAGSDGSDPSSVFWPIRKMQEAGVVIIGKTSMHEFGLDTTGNNINHGTPRNPHNDGYYTGGSSSGTGYIVGAGLVPIGLGSDGGGSIRIPASFCGVFGIKPTHNRISCQPGHNHCNTCAVFGPIAADIKSLATLFEVVAAPHPTSPFPPLPRLRLTPPPNAPRVLGLPEAWFARSTPAIQHLCRSLISRLELAYGYRVVPVTIPFLSEGQVAHAMTVLTDAATLLPYEASRHVTPANRILLSLGRVTPSTDYLLAQKLRRVLMQHLAWLWRQHPGMLLVTPTTACAGWPIRAPRAELRWGLTDGDTTMRTMEYVWMANFCGVPAITVPAGFVVPEGRPGAGEVAGPDVPGRIPVGFMAMGDWCAEEQLLQFGLQAERVGGDLRDRAAAWVDVVEEAKKRK